jgi:hypothetical protein
MIENCNVQNADNYLMDADYSIEKCQLALSVWILVASGYKFNFIRALRLAKKQPV